jgi:hypothetical protein
LRSPGSQAFATEGHAGCCGCGRSGTTTRAGGRTRRPAGPARSFATWLPAGFAKRFRLRGTPDSPDLSTREPAAQPRPCAWRRSPRSATPVPSAGTTTCPRPVDPRRVRGNHDPARSSSRPHPIVQRPQRTRRTLDKWQAFLPTSTDESLSLAYSFVFVAMTDIRRRSMVFPERLVAFGDIWQLPPQDNWP